MTIFHIDLRGMLFLLCLTVAGCSTSSNEHFYALHVSSQVQHAVYEDYSKDVEIAVADVPEIVDRPQIVIFNNSTALNILDDERWAESLKSGISRLLVKDLSATLPKSRVSAIADASKPDAVRVTVHIEEMEANSQGKITLIASWSILRNTATQFDSGRRVFERDAKSPMSAGDAVANWSDEMTSLSQAIARSLTVD